MPGGKNQGTSRTNETNRRIVKVGGLWMGGMGGFCTGVNEVTPPYSLPTSRGGKIADPLQVEVELADEGVCQHGKFTAD
ncbi:MAG: hypothetical protein P9M15_00880 [Candidatus Electryoneaceae bacterium]|nr:hypothetical protein [Candidatus Electryoneaceae bacterium]